jgi:Predicted hydrolases or acyltransferases (alpha/beta hydrolase superfamily)
MGRTIRIAALALVWAGATAGAQRTTSTTSPGRIAQQGGASSSASARRIANTTIVLVHGAFADATSWQEVIPILQRNGYKVRAVQNPLLSADQDVEITRRAIKAETDSGRDVIAVGHSYGGFVITGAAADNPKVRALVYVAAFAPEANERVDAFLKQYPSDLGTALVPDAAGFLYINDAKFHDVFAGDLPDRLTRVASAAQKPIAASAFGATVPTPAWKTIPSWYVVSKQDHAINPDLERFYAKRMNAHTTEVNGSHVAFISHPKEIAKVILDAAASPQK